MDIVFSCINFELTTIKQQTLNSRIYLQKHMLIMISKKKKKQKKIHILI